MSEQEFWDAAFLAAYPAVIAGVENDELSRGALGLLAETAAEAANAALQERRGVESELGDALNERGRMAPKGKEGSHEPHD